MTVPAISPALGNMGHGNTENRTMENNIRARPPGWHRKQALGDSCHLFCPRNRFKRHFGCEYAWSDRVHADGDSLESYLSREHPCKVTRSGFRAVICELGFEGQYWPMTAIC
jgi:hypothetical protein